VLHGMVKKITEESDLVIREATNTTF